MFLTSGSESVMALEKAAALGEGDAMVVLGNAFWFGRFNLEKDKNRAEKLWLSAALLGFPLAQFHLATMCCDADSLERYVWLRNSKNCGGYCNVVEGAERGLSAVC